LRITGNQGSNASGSVPINALVVINQSLEGRLPVTNPANFFQPRFWPVPVTRCRTFSLAYQRSSAVNFLSLPREQKNTAPKTAHWENCRYACTRRTRREPQLAIRRCCGTGVRFRDDCQIPEAIQEAAMGTRHDHRTATRLEAVTLHLGRGCRHIFWAAASHIHTWSLR